MTSLPATSLWRNRPFRALWLGETVSQFGDRVTELALPLIAVTMLNVSPGALGVLVAAIWLPNLLGLFVGAWVDRRTHRRRLLVIADLARAAVLLSLPVGYLLGALSLAQLLVVALLTGAGQVLFSMAYQSFFVALVPPESYLDANSKLSLSRAVSLVAGPALGGGLVQVLTAPVAVVVDAGSFLVSALVTGRIRSAEAPPAPAGPSIVGLAREGLRLVVRHPVLRAALGCTTTVNFFTSIGFTLLVLFASRELGLPAGAIGLAFGIGALGAVGGAALAPLASRLIGAGRTAILGAAVFPAPLAAMALAAGPTPAKIAVLAGAELLSSVGVMLMDVNLNSLIARAPTARSTMASGRSARWPAAGSVPLSGCVPRW